MDVLPKRIVNVRDLGKPVRLHATGDWHLGERGCAEDTLRRDIGKIAEDPDAMVILMGDLVGAIAHDDDRRFDASSVAAGVSVEDLGNWGQVCVEMAAHMARPIASQIYVSLEGNHEAAYRRRHLHPITRLTAAALGTMAGGYSCLFTIRFQCGKHRRDLTVMATHGSGAAATPGGKMNRLIRTAQSFDAALVLMGHVHDSMSYSRTTLYQDGDRIGERVQLGVVTGTYLATYSQGHSGYGERAGYAPTRLGHPVIEITPQTLGLSVGWS